VTKLSLYNIPLKSLSQGLHTFEYDLDNKFFELIDGDEVRKGDVKVRVDVRKTSSTHELDFTLKGVIRIPCTRCLDDMNLDVDTTSRLIVKFGKEYSEESDEVVIIPEDDGEINIAWFLYEFIALSIPIKHVHPAGECNKIVAAKYRKHKAVSVDDYDSDTDDEIDDDDIDIEDDDSQITDPRWDVLKSLNLDDN
jgi:uncharacterized metal-binding protein YceD (DUF177 family)